MKALLPILRAIAHQSTPTQILNGHLGLAMDSTSQCASAAEPRWSQQEVITTTSVLTPGTVLPQGIDGLYHLDILCPTRVELADALSK